MRNILALPSIGRMVVETTKRPRDADTPGAMAQEEQAS
jgi:hypothetical protein